MTSEPTPLTADFEPITLAEESAFYRWRDGLRDYVGTVNAWREIAGLRTQLEQAHREMENIVEDFNQQNIELAEAEARETALREALGKLEVICAQPPSTERRGANAILAKVMGEGWLDGFTGGWQALASYIQFEVLNHEGHTLEEIKAARALSGEQGKQE